MSGEQKQWVWEWFPNVLPAAVYKALPTWRYRGEADALLAIRDAYRGLTADERARLSAEEVATLDKISRDAEEHLLNQLASGPPVPPLPADFSRKDVYDDQD